MKKYTEFTEEQKAKLVTDLAVVRTKMMPLIARDSYSYLEWYDKTQKTILELLNKGNTIEEVKEVIEKQLAEHCKHVKSFNLLTDSEKTKLNGIQAGSGDLIVCYKSITKEEENV